MNQGRHADDDKVLFLRQLVDGCAIVAPDVIEVGPYAWAIHGVIPVGGDVIMAEFETETEAKQALGALAAAPHRPPTS